LPRIPPFRLRGGLRYQYNAFQAGGEVVGVAKQDRVYGAEEPTDGYALLKLFGSYSFARGQSVNTITVRLDNATNELYRNHLSLIKHLVPEMGRNVKLLYSVAFSGHGRPRRPGASRSQATDAGAWCRALASPRTRRRLKYQ
jgi:iron complex outermembrane receptor protein